MYEDIQALQYRSVYVQVLYDRHNFCIILLHISLSKKAGI
jgi:hypothetical protein